MKSVYISIPAILTALSIISIGIGVQSAGAADDNGANIVAPGNINKIPGQIDENAPKAYDNPEDIGDPNSIGDPNARSPGLIK